MSACYRGPQSATLHHILSVSLFCSALHGSWSPRQCALLAQMLDRDASDADRAGAAMALLDGAEDAGWQELGRLPRVEREWLEVTGRHEHVWLPVRDGRVPESGFFEGADARCTCGEFGWLTPCVDPSCRREHGHIGLHAAPARVPGFAMEIEDEWGDPQHYDPVPTNLTARPESGE